MREETHTQKITITAKEYSQLLENREFLLALQSVGVDNWAGYDDAMEILKQERQDRGGCVGDD